MSLKSVAHAFLARLPVREDPQWQSGSFARQDITELNKPLRARKAAEVASETWQPLQCYATDHTL